MEIKKKKSTTDLKGGEKVSYKKKEATLYILQERKRTKKQKAENGIQRAKEKERWCTVLDIKPTNKKEKGEGAQSNNKTDSKREPLSSSGIQGQI